VSIKASLVCGLVVQEPYSLLCSHVFHTTCINSFAKARNVNIANLKCPQCMVSATDLDEDVDSLEPAGSPELIVMAVLPDIVIEDTLLPDTVMEDTVFADVAEMAEEPLATATDGAGDGTEMAEEPLATATDGAGDGTEMAEEPLATAKKSRATANATAADEAAEPDAAPTAKAKAKAKAKPKTKATAADDAAEAGDAPTATAAAPAAGEQPSMSTWPAASAAQWPPATGGSMDASLAEDGGRPADVPGAHGGVAPPSLELAVFRKNPLNIGNTSLPSFDANFLCDSCGRHFPMEKASCHVTPRSGFPRLLARVAAHTFLMSISFGLLWPRGLRRGSYGGLYGGMLPCVVRQKVRQVMHE